VNNNKLESLLESLQRDDLRHTTAIIAHDETLTYSQLHKKVLEVASALNANNMQRVGLYADNSAAWVIMDLACLAANVVIVPIPLFFSSLQIQHLLNTASLDYVFCDRVLPVADDSSVHDILRHNVLVTEAFNAVALLRCFKYPKGITSATHDSMPKGCAKVTFTSGSTGQPKGVCLSAQHQLQVAQALLARVNINAPAHLVALPLSTLLENIAGVYAPLLCGGCIHIPNEAARGFHGSQLVDVGAFLKCISDSQAQTLITVPELLKVMLAASLKGWQAPDSLAFIAVGGAKVSTLMIEQARQCGLPVYQGYGLSECGSVVSLASKDDDPASCGKPLEHLQVQFQDDELYVSGSVFLGYMGEPDTWYPRQVVTGDYAKMHKGKLYIKGRRKQQIINSLGRNISPEWAESLIQAHPQVHQCMVLGESRPYCIAIVTGLSPTLNQSELAQWLIHINQQLPDYAQVQECILLDTPLRFEDGLLTANGRIKREQVESLFTDKINFVYQRRAHQNADATNMKIPEEIKL
jgi:long-subunit acyl-CoA synthetase (AMP-forming)